ncbi:hypothetical protein B0A55_02965, partial [Friedmanniomyces simplex]
ELTMSPALLDAFTQPCDEHTLFGVTEMLGAVLLQLPTTTIFTAQAVCKSFRDAVQTTPEIRQHLFLDLHPNAATQPLLTSSTLVFMRYRNASLINRNAYFDTGRNMWRVTDYIFCNAPDPQSGVLEDQLHVKLETIQKRGGIQFTPRGVQGPEQCGAMQTYISSKPLRIVLTIEFVDCEGDAGDYWFHTGTTEPLRVWELLVKADDTVDEYDDEVREANEMEDDSEDGSGDEEEESSEDSGDEDEDGAEYEKDEEAEEEEEDEEEAE